jgi:hypothetical protein
MALRTHEATRQESFWRSLFEKTSPMAIAGAVFATGLELLGGAPVMVLLGVSTAGALVALVAARAIVLWRRRVPTTPTPNLQLFKQEALEALCAHTRPVPSEAGFGWNHFLDPSRARAGPTVLGTAYGLKLLLWLDPDGQLLDPGDPAETLWSFQKDDGGWASSSQGNLSRPESTALVLSALAPMHHQDARFTRATDRLQELTQGPVTQSRLDLTAITSVILLYTATRPDLREVSKNLCIRLCQGRQHPAAANVSFWPRRMGWGEGPSVLHTARAVAAIDRYLLSHDDQLGRDAVLDGRVWLVRTTLEDAHTSMKVTSEEVRRDVPGLLNLRHFTPAWVLRALAAASDNSGRTQRVKQVAENEIVGYRSGGLWRWPGGGEEPIWMTYQALKALEAAGVKPR